MGKETTHTKNSVKKSLHQIQEFVQHKQQRITKSMGASAMIQNIFFTKTAHISNISIIFAERLSKKGIIHHGTN
jgi:hypothetical protein